MEHVSLMQQAGGVVNGSTRLDYTNYFEVLPSNALDLALWLEADRMRSLDVSAENLKNQQNVVSEEVRVNVLNQPHAVVRVARHLAARQHELGATRTTSTATSRSSRRRRSTTCAASSRPTTRPITPCSSWSATPPPPRSASSPRSTSAAIPKQPLPAAGRHRRAAAEGREALHPRGQAGAHAGAGHRLAPAGADDEGLLRVERARSADHRRRQRAALSEAGAAGSAGHAGDRRVQLPRHRTGT